MAYNSFIDSDKESLLSNPGVFYYRPYVQGTNSNLWVKALFANGANFAKSVSIAEVAFDDVGTVQSEVSEETATVTVSTARVLDLEFIAAVSGGLMTYSTTPGSAATGADRIFTAASESWEYSSPILLSGQNASGAVQTIATVVGSVDGALVDGTDYESVYLPEMGWGIMILNSTDVTTLVQDIVVTYDYTPAATNVLKTGGVKIITPIEVKFVTIDPSGKEVTFQFYKCFANGSYAHGFSPELAADPIVADVSFNVKRDTSRDAPDQLYSVTRVTQ